MGRKAAWEAGFKGDPATSRVGCNYGTVFQNFTIWRI